MRYLVLIAAVAIPLVSASAKVVPGPLPTAAKAEIMRSIKDKLLDGETARWRWPAFSKTAKLEYCGWVSAKNAYGAYTGFRPYFAIIDKGPKGWFSAPMALGTSEAEREFVQEECTKAGYDLLAPPTE